jgi:hypothetical protein
MAEVIRSDVESQQVRPMEFVSGLSLSSYIWVDISKQANIFSHPAHGNIYKVFGSAGHWPVYIFW